MASTQFHLVTEWVLDASDEEVWRVLVAPANWPDWWPTVKRVELLDPGDADGIGAVRRMTWSTALPYDIVFETTTTRVEPLTLIEARAKGELDGIGRWTIAAQGGRTTVRYDWIVEVTKPWMVKLAFLLRPVFAWNHNQVMERGRQGLVAHLARRRVLNVEAQAPTADVRRPQE
ncbi:SRPBCC family protein [Rhizobium sp. TH2]|uniref:SRPBCC family protein n=1 Tax=Rhizobium sp. TH2 TaxID=2775403 RepID=UPI0021580826|nr:SRPBCC family protein [Rhizobium sp. TH2]UVC08509.1 SRPBCC family protein [Rhizobium sp. TH2]